MSYQSSFRKIVIIRVCIYYVIILATKAALESSLLAGRALRKTKTIVFAQLLPEPARKPRKQLTPEEREARNKKACKILYV